MNTANLNTPPEQASITPLAAADSAEVILSGIGSVSRLMADAAMAETLSHADAANLGYLLEMLASLAQGNA